jgi:hypothetical protein
LLCVYVQNVHTTLNADEYADNDVASHVVHIPTILYCVELHHAPPSLHDNVVDISLALHVDQFGLIFVVGAIVSFAFTVIVFGLASKSIHQFVVHPLSCTWNVNVVYGLQYAFDDGTNLNNHPFISATEIVCHALIFDQFNCKFPNDGKVVIFTHAKVFAGLSLVSLNPKLPAMNIC